MGDDVGVGGDDEAGDREGREGGLGAGISDEGLAEGQEGAVDLVVELRTGEGAALAAPGSGAVTLGSLGPGEALGFGEVPIIKNAGTLEQRSRK
jgi:hypothetical protein